MAKSGIRTAFGSVLLVLYPFLAFLAISVFHLTPKVIAAGLLVYAVLLLFLCRKKGIFPAVVIVFLSILVLVTDSDEAMEAYPIFQGLFMLMFFLSPLLRGQSLVEKMAMMMDPSMKKHPGRAYLSRTCTGITLMWCANFLLFIIGNVVFLLDGKLTNAQWTLFNGVFSNVLQLVLAGTTLVWVLLSNVHVGRPFLLTSRVSGWLPGDYVLYSKGDYEYGVSETRTLRDFLRATALLRPALEKMEKTVWIDIEDPWLFFVAVSASLQCGKTVVLARKDGAVNDSFVSSLIAGRLTGKARFLPVDKAAVLVLDEKREAFLSYDTGDNLYSLWRRTGKESPWIPLPCPERFSLARMWRKK